MVDERFSDSQVQDLLGRGDCESHYHSSDRNPQHSTIEALQQLENQANVAANYAAKYSDDYIFCDSTAGTILITLPLAKAQVTTVVRVAGANNVTVQGSGGETVNGAANIVISASYVPRRLKARKTIGYVQV